MATLLRLVDLPHHGCLVLGKRKWTALSRVKVQCFVGPSTHPGFSPMQTFGALVESADDGDLLGRTASLGSNQYLKHPPIPHCLHCSHPYHLITSCMRWERLRGEQGVDMTVFTRKTTTLVIYSNCLQWMFMLSWQVMERVCFFWNIMAMVKMLLWSFLEQPVLPLTYFVVYYVDFLVWWSEVLQKYAAWWTRGVCLCASISVTQSQSEPLRCAGHFSVHNSGFPPVSPQL